MVWSEWITKKYDAFRQGKYGNAASVTAFARQFGAPHQIVLGWMRPGSEPPRKLKYINAILRVYGEEAYEALGITGPIGGEEQDPRRQQLLELIDAAPPEAQEALLDLVTEFLESQGWQRVK